jgi:hypothetical protein
MPLATRIQSEFGVLLETEGGRYILLENGGYLLLEDGSRLLLETGSTVGVTSPAVGQYQALRVISLPSFGLYKETYESQEVSPSRMMYDSRHGVRRVEGVIDTNLFVVDYDPFWLSLMGRSFWETPAVQFSGSITSSAATVTRSSGSFLLDGFSPGDRVLITGFDEAQRLLSILSVSPDGLSVTFDESAPPGAYPSFSMSRHGRRLPMGREPVSLTMERAHRNLNLFQYFTGTRVSSFSVETQVDEYPRAVWSLQASQASRVVSQSISGVSSYRPALQNPPLPSLFSTVWLVPKAGEPLALAASTFSFLADNELDASPVVGANKLSDLSWGNRMRVTGDVTLFLDPAVSAFFEANTETGIFIRFSQIGSNSKEYLSFFFPRCLLSSIQLGDKSQEPAIMGSFSFTALAPSDGLSQFVVVSSPEGSYDLLDPVIAASDSRLITEAGYIMRTEAGYELLRETG